MKKAFKSIDLKASNLFVILIVQNSNQFNGDLDLLEKML